MMCQAPGTKDHFKMLNEACLPDKNHIDGNPGYQTGQLSAEELALLKELIKEQYITRISEVIGEACSGAFKAHDMSQYHLYSEQLDHKAMWPKSERILSNKSAKKVMALPFFQRLVDHYGVCAVTAEEQLTEAEFYWRIVRPGNQDMGDLHADKWFWDINEFQDYPGMERIKIWIAIESEPGKNGLTVLPGSHLQEHWQYHYEQDVHGKSRPKFDESQTQGLMLDLPLLPGEFVVFHDKLIHGGMVNQANQTRVSLEATLLVPEQQ